ncbi:hypothetical protein FI667_g3001, partial [Globisporangium splendens]
MDLFSDVDLGPQEQEKRAKAEQERRDEREHELEEKILLWRDDVREEDREERQTREQQQQREAAVRVWRHWTCVWDFLQTRSTIGRRTSATKTHK